MIAVCQLKPAVPRPWLLALAGAMWMSVGVLLCTYAVDWLSGAPPWTGLLLGALGILAALVIYRLGFGRMAVRNADRIGRLHERPCLFSFIAWKSYLIVVVMMTGGILLKQSPIPKMYLAVLYLGIGGGLFLSSFLYYRRLLPPKPTV